VPHITLKSIANNSRIDQQGMRVARPFTVEGAPLLNFCRTL
jgi:hypothetical protein